MSRPCYHIPQPMLVEAFRAQMTSFPVKASISFRSEPLQQTYIRLLEFVLLALKLPLLLLLSLVVTGLGSRLN